MVKSCMELDITKKQKWHCDSQTIKQCSNGKKNAIKQYTNNVIVSMGIKFKSNTTTTINIYDEKGN